MTIRDAPARLELLDRFTVRVAGQPVSVPPLASLVLSYLAVRMRPIHRTVIAATLWPALQERRALANLRTALYRISIGVPLLRSTTTLVELDPEVSVDLRDATAFARSVIRDQSMPERIEPALDLLGRELLPDWGELWIEPERERFRQLRLHALQALSSRLSAAGRHAEAVEVAQTAVLVEPASESAERTLVGAFVAEGNGALALREIQAFRRRLWDDLRVRPSAELERLRAELARGDERVARHHRRLTGAAVTRRRTTDARSSMAGGHGRPG
jgi:DNA-binding SARP family transcriptional activator